MTEARFLTFEGGEGAGKSTQLRRLADALRGAGVEVCETREPGGSAGAEAIRAILLGGGTDRWDAMTEALLIAAARRDHLLRTIRPALAAGRWVLCDRFADSTRAYQGAAGGVPEAALRDLHRLATEDARPDLTLVLDIDPALGLARARSRGAPPDRFERRGADFHATLRDEFLRIAAAEPARCVVIDAAGEAASVADAVRRAVAERFGLRLG